MTATSETGNTEGEASFDRFHNCPVGIPLRKGSVEPRNLRLMAMQSSLHALNLKASLFRVYPII